MKIINLSISETCNPDIAYLVRGLLRDKRIPVIESPEADKSYKGTVLSDILLVLPPSLHSCSVGKKQAEEIRDFCLFNMQTEPMEGMSLRVSGKKKVLLITDYDEISDKVFVDELEGITFGRENEKDSWATLHTNTAGINLSSYVTQRELV